MCDIDMHCGLIHCDLGRTPVKNVVGVQFNWLSMTQMKNKREQHIMCRSVIGQVNAETIIDTLSKLSQ